MTSNHSFEFETDQMFSIVGRGLVFIGYVTKGVAKPGDRLTFIESEDQVSGTIGVIESARALVDETPHGLEIGILLKDLSSHPNIIELIRAITMGEVEVTDEYFDELLGVTLPTRLVIVPQES